MAEILDLFRVARLFKVNTDSLENIRPLINSPIDHEEILLMWATSLATEFRSNACDESYVIDNRLFLHLENGALINPLQSFLRQGASATGPVKAPLKLT